jgi:hypothetical protein
MSRNTLRRRLCVITILAFLAFEITSCRKDPADKPSKPDTVLTTPAGNPVGNGISKTIGATGGTIATEDGRLTINIPAGAVSENTTIIIYPVNNENPVGIGQAFRLIPHQNFLKPVQIVFTYEEEELKNTVAMALAASWQDHKGAWHIMGGTIDTNNKKVTIETTHFSDWSLIKTLELTPRMAVLNFNKTIKLFVQSSLPGELIQPEELPLPLGPGEYGPQTPPIDIVGTFIEKWNLAEEGVLIPKGSVADYIAPASIPARNPVAVSVTLKPVNGKQYTLVSNLYIGNDAINLRIDNGPWLRGPSPLGMVVQNSLRTIHGGIIRANQPQGVVTIVLNGEQARGFSKWGVKNRMIPSFLYGPGNSHTFHHYHGAQVIVSGGGIDYDYEDVGGERYFYGVFTIPGGGEIYPEGNGTAFVPHSMQGYFRVKLN